MESQFSGKLLLTVEEVATSLSLGRSKVYDLIAKGEIPSIKIHGSRRIPVNRLHEWVNAHTATPTSFGREDRW